MEGSRWVEEEVEMMAHLDSFGCPEDVRESAFEIVGCCDHGGVSVPGGVSDEPSGRLPSPVLEVTDAWWKKLR